MVGTKRHQELGQHQRRRGAQLGGVHGRVGILAIGPRHAGQLALKTAAHAQLQHFGPTKRIAGFEAKINEWARQVGHVGAAQLAGFRKLRRRRRVDDREELAGTSVQGRAVRGRRVGHLAVAHGIEPEHVEVGQQALGLQGAVEAIKLAGAQQHLAGQKASAVFLLVSGKVHRIGDGSIGAQAQARACAQGAGGAGAAQGVAGSIAQGAAHAGIGSRTGLALKCIRGAPGRGRGWQ